MTRVRKPCPGCGAIDPGRAADGVCHECETLIKEAKARRAELAKAPGHALYVLRAWPYLPIQTDGYEDSSEARRVIDLLSELLRALSDRDPVPAWHRQNNEGIQPRPVFGDKRDSDPDAYYGGGKSFWARPEHVALLADLDGLLRRMFDSSYRRGFGDGQGLLVSLAAGRTSLTSFNEKVEKETKLKR